ncbi:TfuA domain-containing protein [Krasilnikovia cinnamomea]|nr:TfuA domain-containing protein [Krasilnikovia cinnamomea]
MVVIIDGYFHQVASVRHKEILQTLARRVTVIGCSSLGALRAAELVPYGMVGNGVVFEMYRAGAIDADDEVAVVHGEAPEYRKFGMPLVSLRHAVAMAQQDGAVSAPEGAGLVAACRGLPYSARSWRAVEAVLSRDDPEHAGAVRRLRGYLAQHPEHADVKAADAIDTLKRLAELGARRSVCDEGWIDSPRWRNRLLHEWHAEFAGSWVDGIHVSDRAVMQYQQIYRNDLAQRWSTFALRGIRDGAELRAADVPDGGLEAAVLAVAAAYGVDDSRLTPEQRAEWLTPQEADGLESDAAVLRVLVRSYSPPRGILDLIVAEPELVTDQAARVAVAESFVVNAEVVSWAPKNGLAYLRHSVLRDHLAARWGSDDERSLTAAARDRGFVSLVEAVEAVRPFFLRHHLSMAVATPAARLEELT